MTKPWDATSEHLLRELAPQVLGAVARRFHDAIFVSAAVADIVVGPGSVRTTNIARGAPTTVALSGDFIRGGIAVFTPMQDDLRG